MMTSQLEIFMKKLIRQIHIDDTYPKKGLRDELEIKWKNKKSAPEGGKVRKFLSQDQGLTNVNIKLKPVSEQN